MLAGQRVLTTQKMDRGNIIQSEGQTVGMEQCLGYSERLLTPPEGLVGIAKPPQNIGCVAAAGHPGVMAVQKGIGTMLVEIVQDDPLLYVCSGGGQLSQLVQCRPQCIVRLDEQGGILGMLGEGEEPFAQLTRRP
jgi:hypothetical protein